MQIEALLEIALRYPEFDDGGQWRAIALRRLRRFVAASVSPDGVALELSPGYHHFITAKLMWTLALLKQVGDPYVAELEPVVTTMVDQAVELLQPDGSFPGIGDTNPGRIQPRRVPWPMLPGSVGARWLQHCQGLPNQPGVWRSPGAGYVVLRAPAPTWTERDALMVELASRFPDYGWDENKGYSSPSHIDALRRLGPCEEHRRLRRPSEKPCFIEFTVASVSCLYGHRISTIEQTPLADGLFGKEIGGIGKGAG